MSFSKASALGQDLLILPVVSVASVASVASVVSIVPETEFCLVSVVDMRGCVFSFLLFSFLLFSFLLFSFLLFSFLLLLLLLLLWGEAQSRLRTCVIFPKSDSFVADGISLNAR
jgi:hypothetical protein